MRKKHKIASKPYLGSLLFCLLGFLVPGFLGEGLNGVFKNLTGLDNIGSCLLPIVFIFLFKLWFKPEFSGCFRAEEWNIKFLIPFVIILGMDWIVNGVSLSNTTSGAIMNAITAGILEETAFRVFPVSVFLRGKRKENDIIKGAIFTSVIFGIFHMTNMLSGAGLGVSAVQVCSTFAAGMLFAALYIRTGSVIPSMFLHGLHDFICFLDPSTVDAEGIVIAELTSDVIITEGVAIVVNLALALFILRPSVRKNISALWDKKWGGAN